MVASSAESARGNPATVAMRVEHIAYVVQIEGDYSLATEYRLQEGTAIVPLNGLGTVEVTQEENRVQILLKYSFRAVSEDSDEADAPAVERDPFFTASATFLIEYELDSPEPAGQVDLRAFGEINGRLNTIPYWREYLHSSLLRAGLPAYEVPPFNPVKIARSIGDAPADDADD